MSQVTVTIDGAAAVIAQVELAELARWHRGRALLLAALRGTDAPTEAETTSLMWAKMLGSVATALERELYPVNCATCGHRRDSHSSGGMCDGGGTECYCVRFPDAPDFAGPLAPCRCADPVCPKVHPVDMGADGWAAEYDSRRQLTETLTHRSAAFDARNPAGGQP